MTQVSRKALRNSLRQARRALSPEQQSAAAQGLCSLLRSQDFFRRAHRIAFYQLFDAELDPGPLLELALSQGKSCFLPVVNQDKPGAICFAAYNASTELVENRWGIAEPPAPVVAFPPTDLDLVLVPLVGFNEQCFRLGLGKGYYDRTFSFKLLEQHSRPLLVGLAHECQRVEGEFPDESWDVHLDAIATAEKIYRPDTAQGGH
jgi:5-formyltetrahydrofolate cyclo-ligase